MEFTTDKKTLKRCIKRFIHLIEQNVDYIKQGYTVSQIPEGRGINQNGVLRHHIFLGYNEEGARHNLLEITIPYEYNGNIGAIRGRVAIDEDNNHYILRSTVGMTTSGRINIREQVEDSLRNRIVEIDEKSWINICNIDIFNINDVIAVLEVIKSCREGVFFQNVPGEIFNPSTVTEGAKQAVIVNKYERDTGARNRCIEHWGVKCKVCYLSFQEQYGDYGSGYIHVHHLKPLSEIGEEYQLDSIKDMRPVCPNCHAMIHRSTPALTIDELKKMRIKS